MMVEFGRRKFLLAAALAYVSCGEVTPTPSPRFNLEFSEAKDYKKKLYLYNDFPNSRLSISPNFIEELLSDPSGAQYPDETPIAIFFARTFSSVQQRNYYYSEATVTWNKDLIEGRGKVPARKTLIVLSPEDYITRNKNGLIDPQTHKNLSEAFVRILKEEADKLSGKQPSQMPGWLRNKTLQQEPIRVTLR